MAHFDVVVIGAGAAGLFCAGVAGRLGLRVAVLDHARQRAEKIRISGGGRCNFTNREADRPERFLGEDPGFGVAALKAYRPRDFLALLRAHRIGWHEKHLGQLFCDDSSERIIELLHGECARGSVRVFQPCAVRTVERPAGLPGFRLGTEAGSLEADALVLATGGLSIPKIGATDFGHRLARQWGLRVIEPRPALVPLTFEPDQWQAFSGLSGLSLPVALRLEESAADPTFHEDLLITHRGLSGPAALQISSYWRAGQSLSIDLAPHRSLETELREAREGSRQQLGTVLAEILPRRLGREWLLVAGASALGLEPSRRLAELGNGQLQALARGLHAWSLKPVGTEGWRKAEVTAGGIATTELDPRTMQSHRVPGLYCIGEVVDVTGWLGGYNFQWAWASAWAAAQGLAASRGTGSKADS